MYSIDHEKMHIKYINIIIIQVVFSLLFRVQGKNFQTVESPS